MSFNSLADEVLLQIIEHIPDPWTLYQLLLCSKRLSGLVTPKLYASVTFGYPYENFERFRRFADAVLRSPEKALYVRFFSTDCWTNRDHFEHTSVRHAALPAGLDFNYLETVVRRYSHSEAEVAEWMADLKTGVDDALLVLVLQALIKLEHFETLILSGSRYYDRVLAQARNSFKGSDPLPCFNSLTTLTVSGLHMQGGVKFTDLRLFFAIPSMRRIYGVYVVPARRSNDKSTQEMLEADDPKHAPLPPHSSGITHIEMNSSGLGPADFEEIFRACNCIKTFIYRHRDGPVGHHDFSASGIARALPAAKHSLEELWVEIEHIEECLSYATEEHVLIGSLRYFTALRSMRAQPAVLLGPGDWSVVHLIEVLPHSLESLYLSACFRISQFLDVLAEIETVLAEKTSRFPRLSKISCEGPFSEIIYFDNSPLECSPEIDPPPPKPAQRSIRVMIPYEFARLRLLAEVNDVLIEVADRETHPYDPKRIELGTYMDSVLANPWATTGT